ncbi:MAG: hypothetical protein M1817_001826 [Caeruleum heppii]|nr:MAG: hypothetical protein M1817_001826 [Caeruleum heppii]
MSDQHVNPATKNEKSFAQNMMAGVAGIGNAAGTAAGGVINTAGETVQTAAKGAGSTVQGTVGALTGGDGGKGTKVEGQGQGQQGQSK